MAQLHETTFRMVKGIILLTFWFGLLWIVLAPIFAARKQRRRLKFDIESRDAKGRPCVIISGDPKLILEMQEFSKSYDAGIPIG